MHEVAIAEEIKEIVLEKMKEHNKSKVTRVKIIAGEMTSIVPEALEFAFASVALDSPMQNAKVEIKVKKLKAVCKNCKNKFRVKDFMYICPECGSQKVEVVEGKEMLVQTIDME